MNSSPERSDRPPVVLIHGLWMTPRSWEHWAERFRGRGYDVHTPAWPGLEVEVEELRRDPAPLTRLDIKRIVDHYESVIRTLPSPPIVMGHSIGGTLMQLVIDRGLGSAGVGISAGTVKGVYDLPLSTIKSAMPVLGNPFNRGKATGLNPKQFHYAFGNTMSREESDRIYERYHVPAANRVLFQFATGNYVPNSPIKVDLADNERAPLLFIGFDQDHVVPAKATRHNAEKYNRKSPRAVADFKEFPGRPHFPGAPGWEEVADYAIEWAERQVLR